MTAPLSTSPGVTAQGFQRQRLDVLLQQLEARLKDPSVMGSDAVLNGTTPDGQIVGIMGEIEDELYQMGEDAYNVADPTNALGAALFRLGRLAGLTVKTGGYGRVTCQVHVKAGETLPAGTPVQDASPGGVMYATLTEVVSTDETVGYQVQAQAQAYGPAAKATTTLTTNLCQKGADVYGWIDVSFYADGTTGTPPETQSQFRQRLLASPAKPSQGMFDSLLAALDDLPGIGQVRVFNNPRTQWADIKTGDQALPPNSFAVVARNAVSSGGVDQIARTIWLYGNPGSSSVGDHVVQIIDQQGAHHPVAYYLSQPYAIDVEITCKPILGQGFDPNAAEDISALKGAIVAWANATQMPGDDVLWATLFPVALGDVGSVDADGKTVLAPRGRSGGYAIEISLLRIRPHGGTWVTADLTVPFNQHASISAANITLVQGT